MKLSEAIVGYLQWCERENGNTKTTINSKGIYLEKFFEWSGNINVKKINADLARKYRDYLTYNPDKKPYKPVTVKYCLELLRHLIYYLKLFHLTSEDPSIVPKVKARSRRLVFFDQEAFEQLVEHIDTRKEKGVKQRAIAETLFSTGLRLSELISLNKDLNLETGELVVVGKFKKIRVVYLNERAKYWISEYLKFRHDDNPALFVSADPYGNTRLSKAAIFKMVKRLCRIAGLPDNISPHTFRHSFATNLINKGVDIGFVKQFLGHTSVDSTLIYTHYTNPQLKTIHEEVMNF